jgi:hypothetical protein
MAGGRVSRDVTDPNDVCDRNGRFARLWISALVGLVGSFAIAILLPTRDHFPGPFGGCGFSHPDQGWLVQGGDPVLMLAGAIGIAVAVYAMWNQRVRSVAKALGIYVQLPRAVARHTR